MKSTVPHLKSIIICYCLIPFRQIYFSRLGPERKCEVSEFLQMVYKALQDFIWILSKITNQEWHNRKSVNVACCNAAVEGITVMTDDYFNLHLWEPDAKLSPLPPSACPGTFWRGIQQVTKSFVSNGAIFRSECHRVGPSPLLFTNRASWYKRTDLVPKCFASTAVW